MCSDAAIIAAKVSGRALGVEPIEQPTSVPASAALQKRALPPASMPGSKRRSPPKNSPVVTKSHRPGCMAAANPERARLKAVINCAHWSPPPSPTRLTATNKLQTTPAKQASRHVLIDRPKIRINSASASKETGP